ncbi:MAG: hypothetical protein RLZZ406_1357, partial [Pseudomonadota bacterium]
MLIHGQRKTSVVNLPKSIAAYAMATFAISAFAQISGNSSPASVTVQSGDSSLASPPSIGAQLSTQDPSSKAAELFAPVTKTNTPKIYVKSVPSGSTEMDLRQLWNELKTNNPQ